MNLNHDIVHVRYILDTSAMFAERVQSWVILRYALLKGVEFVERLSPSAENVDFFHLELLYSAAFLDA